jgi:hypothetical protein
MLILLDHITPYTSSLSTLSHLREPHNSLRLFPLIKPPIPLRHFINPNHRTHHTPRPRPPALHQLDKLRRQQSLDPSSAPGPYLSNLSTTSSISRTPSSGVTWYNRSVATLDVLDSLAHSLDNAYAFVAECVHGGLVLPTNPR